MSNSKRPQLTTELTKALAAAVPWRAAYLWMYLFTRAGNDTAETWPTLRTISKDLGANRSNIVRDIQRLEKAGWLEVIRKDGARNHYWLRVPLKVDTETTTVALGGVPETTTEVGTETTTGGTRNDNKNRTQTKTQTETQPKAPAEEPELPFDSDRFRQSWEDFRQFRKDINHPLTEKAVSRLLNKCKRFGEAKAIEAIDNSIESSWRGLFDPDERKGKKQPVPSGNGDGSSRDLTKCG